MVSQTSEKAFKGAEYNKMENFINFSFCPHVVGIGPPRTSRQPRCSQCKTKRNLWRCHTIDCGLVFCGGRVRDHAQVHYQESPDHVIQENVSSGRLWCHLCNREVVGDSRNPRQTPAISFSRDDHWNSPPNGIQNLGNTCYMNAVLQNLASISQLTSYLTKGPIHDSNPADETRSSRICHSYREFLKEFFSHSNQSPVKPSHLFRDIWLAHPMFRGLEQHDSQEFLRLIMGTLAMGTEVPHFTFEEHSKANEDREQESDTESFETADSGNGSEETVSNDDGTNKSNLIHAAFTDTVDSAVYSLASTIPPVKVIMKSILDDVCNGQLESSVQCLSCHETSRRLELFQDLSLPIPTQEEFTALQQRDEMYLEDGEEPLGWYDWVMDWLKWLIWGPSPSLNDCLAAFFSSDELKDKNMYSCEKCKTLRNGLKRCSLYHLPEVLCVHLKRFRIVESTPGAVPRKISKFVKFPLDGLDVRPFLHPDCPDRVTNYRLMGVICHHGSIGVGHYIAYIRKQDRWYITDDCRVVEVSPEVVENCEAYILFYHKWDTDQHESDSKRQLLATWAKCDSYPAATKKFHLISRKWLTKYMWAAEKIPLDNTDVVCPHGRLAPVDNLQMSATWVPDVVWDAIRCGGGPDLEMAEFCQECKLVLETYRKTSSKRRSLASAGSPLNTMSFSKMDGGYQQNSEEDDNYDHDTAKVNVHQEIGVDMAVPIHQHPPHQQQDMVPDHVHSDMISQHQHHHHLANSTEHVMTEYNQPHQQHPNQDPSTNVYVNGETHHHQASDAHVDEDVLLVVHDFLKKVKLEGTAELLKKEAQNSEEEMRENIPDGEVQSDILPYVKVTKLQTTSQKPTSN